MPLNIFGLGAGKILQEYVSNVTLFLLFYTNAYFIQSEGGGCGVGLGLGWGFGAAYGSRYYSPGLTFQGVEFESKSSEGKDSKNLSKNN